MHLAGFSPDGTYHYSNSLNKCITSWGGYAYLVNKKAYKKLIDTISEERLQVDTYYTKIQKDMKWFKAKEMLVYHLAGISDVEGVYRDLAFLRK